jgi:hypothetical protein
MFSRALWLEEGWPWGQGMKVEFFVGPSYSAVAMIYDEYTGNDRGQKTKANSSSD